MVRTAFVSTYPPRNGAIATFTHDLAKATDSREIVALHPPDQATPYPAEVHHRIRRDEHADYPHAARALEDCVDVVSIQHRFGIWGGGADGEWVLDFIRALRLPAVTTLHTIPGDPTAGQRAVIAELVARSSATIVMTRSAVALLSTAYGADMRQVEIIPYGVPDLPLVDSVTMKPALGLEGRTVLLSFGLLRPNKGYELVLDALAKVIRAHPSTLYAIVGATDPDVRRTDGDAYRQSLAQRVERLHLGDHVRFVDRFVGRVELTRWLEAADVFITPYLALDQAVSGTLSYAMGAGRAIVSTPYTYAAEMLADGAGMIVPSGSAADLTTHLLELLGDPDRRAAIGRRAYEASRGMVWSAVGAEYRRLFARVTGTQRATRRPGSFDGAHA
jgi:glycosyltransferase involved in cell wall biosynthesis